MFCHHRKFPMNFVGSMAIHKYRFKRLTDIQPMIRRQELGKKSCLSERLWATCACDSVINQRKRKEEKRSNAYNLIVEWLYSHSHESMNILILTQHWIAYIPIIWYMFYGLNVCFECSSATWNSRFRGNRCWKKNETAPCNAVFLFIVLIECALRLETKKMFEFTHAYARTSLF